MPQFDQLGDTSLVAPELCHLEESESDLNEYMLEPTDPVVCLPDLPSVPKLLHYSTLFLDNSFWAP